MRITSKHFGRFSIEDMGSCYRVYELVDRVSRTDSKEYKDDTFYGDFNSLGNAIYNILLINLFEESYVLSVTQIITHLKEKIKEIKDE